MKDSKAKYFCENCGSEVGANARFCPKCGKFFSSVRCPKCGNTGPVTDFKNGCPQCHYTVPKSSSKGNSTSDGLRHKLSAKSKKNIKSAFKSHSRSASDQTYSGHNFPAWLMVACIITLVGILVFTAYYFH